MSAEHESLRDEERAPEHLWQSRPVRWSAASGLLWLTGFFAEYLFDLNHGFVAAVYVAATLAGVRYFAREALSELVGEREVGIEMLMLVAACTAGLLTLWGEAATLAFLYSTSEALEEFTEDRTRGAIRALMDLAPKRVTRLGAGGAQEEIDLDKLRVDDRFLVRPGEGVATDGVVEDGRSALNEAAITGESLPVEKSTGSKVFAGTLNTSGALVVRATATAADNTLAKIVELVSEAQEQKGRGERFMQRFARRYSPTVLVTGVVVILLGGILSGDWSSWAERAAAFLVAAAPCALVISIPVSYVAAIGNASRQGVLIKGGIYLEELAQLRVLALDKTGTITAGRPTVVGVHTLNGVRRDELLRLAAAVEMRSEHPLARAIVGCVNGAELPAVADFVALVGAGAEGIVDGRWIVVGSPVLMTERGATDDALDAMIAAMQQRGQTAVVVADAHRPLGVIGIADVIRDHAADAVAELHRLGINHIVMLTGDNRRAAGVVAGQIGVDGYEAELKPDDKSAVIGRLRQTYRHVGMVGDGVNDAPALAAASVGIAMGTAGSDVALETADVALMSDDLSSLTAAVRIGRRTRTIVKQNLSLGFLILSVLIPGALSGWLGLPIAVLAHELSELAVIVNALRLARR